MRSTFSSLCYLAGVMLRGVLVVLFIAALAFMFTQLAKGQVNDKALDLSWQDNSNNETHWVIERALVLAGPWTPIATIESVTGEQATPGGSLSSLPADSPDRVRTGYRDVGLGPNTVYLYRVRAQNQAGNSAPSNTASATTDGPVVPTPTPTPTPPPSIAKPSAPSQMKAVRVTPTP